MKKLKMLVLALAIFMGGCQFPLERIPTIEATLYPTPVVKATAVPEEEGKLYWFTPVWDLGATSDDPRIADNGFSIAVAAVQPLANGELIDLWIYLKSGRGAYLGNGTGSYQFFLPEEYAFLLPNEGVEFAGSANIWISGGGISDFTGSAKWTFRNADHGAKIILSFEGVEWDSQNPKQLGEFKLRLHISYAK